MIQYAHYKSLSLQSGELSGMQRPRFKPRAGNNIFFIFIVCD